MKRNLGIEEKSAKIYNHYGNWVLANLTEQEFSLLSRNEDDSFRTGNLGYISPSKIKKYFSSKLNQGFEGSPNLHVRIDFEDEWERMHIAGEYYFIHGDLKKEYDIILLGPILISDVEGNKIEAKYVVEDNSGRIIPVTEDRVNKEIEKLGKLEIISEGDFTKVERLSKVAGVDYSEKIGLLQKYNDEKISKRYSSRENLENVLERFESSAGSGCISLFDEMSGDLEVLGEFLEYLPKIELPEDIKERTIKFFRSYAQAYNSHISDAEETLKENQENLENLKSRQQYFRGLACEVKRKG